MQPTRSARSVADGVGEQDVCHRRLTWETTPTPPCGPHGSDAGASPAPAGQAAARPPTGLCGVVDLRVRRGNPGRARARHRLGVRPRPRRPRLVAHQPGRPFLQQPPPVERRSVHGLHGHPPVGQVLDGGVAGAAGPDLGHRRGGIRGIGRRVFHRLPVPTELRLAVDFDQRQGRLQCRRRGRLLQPHELRPDADVAHRVDPARARRARRRTRARGAGPGSCPPAARPSRPRQGRAAGRRCRRPGRLARARPGVTTS